MGMLLETGLEFLVFKIDCCGMHGMESKVKLRIRLKSTLLVREKMFCNRMDFLLMTLIKQRGIKITKIA